MTEREIPNLQVKTSDQDLTGTDSNAQENGALSRMQEEALTKVGDDTVRVQGKMEPDAPVGNEEAERLFRELFKGFIEGGEEESLEPKSKPAEPENLAPNKGREAFEGTVGELEAKNIKNFREEQPKFREAINLGDKHLVDAANQYVKEGYDSGRFERLYELGEELGQGIDGVYDSLKKIPLHTNRVKAVELINKYLHSDTADGDKPQILAQLDEIGPDNLGLSQTVKKLGADQDELKPLYIKEQEERARVFMAYRDAAEIRSAYAEMLQTAIAAPSTGEVSDQADAKELEELGISGLGLETRFGQYAEQPMISNEAHIQLEPPEPPRTFQA